jgi:hypothetical protein
MRVSLKAFAKRTSTLLFDSIPIVSAKLLTNVSDVDTYYLLAAPVEESFK